MFYEVAQQQEALRPQLDLGIAAAQGTAPEIERKSRKTIGFLADRLHRLAPSPREIGSLLWRRFQHLFRIFAPRFQDIVAVAVRPLLPRRAARSTETSTMASRSGNARAGLAAMQRRNDREQLHQATSDYVAGRCDLVGCGRYSESRRGLRLERHSGRYRDGAQTAGSDLLPDDGHRPVGRLRSRKRHYQALSDRWRSARRGPWRVARRGGRGGESRDIGKARTVTAGGDR